MRLFTPKPKKPTAEQVEIIRLRTEVARLLQVEQLTKKMVKLLDDGKVDYDMLRELKKYL